MKKITLTILAMTGLAGLVQTACGSDDTEQSGFPQITAQPTDQGIFEGESTTFSVQATNGDLSYQWCRNGVPIEGQTNRTLAVENVGVNDAGLYSCEVAKSGGEAVPTRAAALNVAAPSSLGGGQIILYGLAKVSNGRQGTCPGSYAGYINFTKTVAQGWGWAPSTNTTTIFTASDGGGRTDTKIVYLGINSDSGCNQTPVTIPNPPYSPKYRFSIYCPNNVPTTNYPIVLTGFDP